MDEKTQTSSLEYAHIAFDSAQNFVQHFGENGGNLLLYGDTGTGKTFLSNCIAKDLLDRGFSVIYFTAFQLFDIFEKEVFHKDSDAIEMHQQIFSCDLLIIDDLGTEFANSFTTSQLFLCLNERLLHNKSTVISTNLSMKQIRDLYSERTSSRIISSYTPIKFFGNDIRIEKKLTHK
jgi:DNA replication protein DnaC